MFWIITPRRGAPQKKSGLPPSTPLKSTLCKYMTLVRGRPVSISDVTSVVFTIKVNRCCVQASVFCCLLLLSRAGFLRYVLRSRHCVKSLKTDLNSNRNHYTYIIAR
jgi:hypothetical protein